MNEKKRSYLQEFDIHDSEIYCVFCFDIMLEMYYEEERMRIGL